MGAGAKLVNVSTSLFADVSCPLSRRSMAVIRGAEPGVLVLAIVFLAKAKERLEVSG